MKNYQYGKIGLFVCASALITSIQICDADLAAASGTLAGIAVVSTQASTGVATAANSGDIEAISEAQTRSSAVDSAMAEAQEAYSAMERAVAAGDEDAEASASDDLDSAYQKALDALNGTVPELSKRSVRDQWKESQTNTGGGPGAASGGYDSPNIYAVPMQTAGQQSTSASSFSTINSSSGGSGASSNSFGDSDATPN